MSHCIFSNEPPHILQWSTASPQISQRISSNDPPHILQWATASPNEPRHFLQYCKSSLSFYEPTCLFQWQSPIATLLMSLYISYWAVLSLPISNHISSCAAISVFLWATKYLFLSHYISSNEQPFLLLSRYIYYYSMSNHLSYWAAISLPEEWATIYLLLSRSISSY